MGFILKVNDGRYVKRTAKFGSFHGSIYLTDKVNEARVWSRKPDAMHAGGVFNWRVGPNGYKFDQEKFSGLSCTVESEVVEEDRKVTKEED